MDFRRARDGRVLTAGRFPNDSGADGDKCANVCTCAHEHTVSRPDISPHAYSDEFAHCHTNTGFGAVGNGYTRPDGHADTYEHTYTVSNSNQYSDTGGYGHTDSYTFAHKLAYADTYGTTHGCPDRHAYADSGPNRDAHVKPHSAK